MHAPRTAFCSLFHLSAARCSCCRPLLGIRSELEKGRRLSCCIATGSLPLLLQVLLRCAAMRGAMEHRVLVLACNIIADRSSSGLADRNSASEIGE